jgi:hypothetical protein
MAYFFSIFLHMLFESFLRHGLMDHHNTSSSWWKWTPERARRGHGMKNERKSQINIAVQQQQTLFEWMNWDFAAVMRSFCLESIFDDECLSTSIYNKRNNYKCNKNLRQFHFHLVVMNQAQLLCVTHYTHIYTAVCFHLNEGDIST